MLLQMRVPEAADALDAAVKALNEGEREAGASETLHPFVERSTFDALAAAHEVALAAAKPEKVKPDYHAWKRNAQGAPVSDVNETKVEDATRELERAFESNDGNASERAFHQGLLAGLRIFHPAWQAVHARRKRRSDAAAAAWGRMLAEADGIVASGGVPALTDNIVPLPRRGVEES